MGVSERDEQLLGRQSAGKDLRIPGVQHSSPAQIIGQWRARREKFILSINCRNLTPNASFFMATTKALVGTYKKSKKQLFYLLKHEQSGHGTLKQEFAPCCPLSSLTRHSLLPDGGVTQQKKGRLQANMAQPETSPGSGLITCLSPTPLHVHLALSHVTDCTAAKDYGSKTQCTQLVSPLRLTQTVPFVSPCCTGDLFCLTHPPPTVLLIK